MKINPISRSCSFGALIEDKKHASGQQKILISLIKKSMKENECYVNLLENKKTDIFISPNDDKKSVDLKLLTLNNGDPLFVYTPKDKDGEIKVNIHVPPQSFSNNEYADMRLEGNIRIRTGRFLRRAVYGLYK